MPLGIVTDDEFLAELNGPTGPANTGPANTTNTKGRPKDGAAVPEVIREIASEAAISGVPAAEISRDLGISRSSISAYKHDATSTTTYNKPASHLASANARVRDRISGKAKRVLLQALDSITEEKLAAAKVVDASSIAKNMAGIMKDMEPPSQHPTSNVQFVFHVPRQRSEKEFDIIEVTS